MKEIKRVPVFLKHSVDSNYYAVLKVLILEGDLVEVITLKPLSSVSTTDLRRPALYPSLN